MALEFLDRGAGADLHSLLLEGLAREGADLRVLDGQHAVLHLDHRRLRAHRVIEARELHADRTRPDDQQAVRHVRRLQRVAIGPDARAVGLETRQFTGAGAGGDHDVRGLQHLLARLCGHGDAALARKTPGAAHDGHPVLLHQVVDTGRELPRDLARAVDHLVEVEADTLSREAEVARAVHLVVEFGGAQQRLRRDAAPVEADAAHVLALDDGDREAELRGADGTDVAPRPRADHDDIERPARHVASCRVLRGRTLCETSLGDNGVPVAQAAATSSMPRTTAP